MPEEPIMEQRFDHKWFVSLSYLEKIVSRGITIIKSSKCFQNAILWAYHFITLRHLFSLYSGKKNI